jgi:hypothetical protein
MQPLGSDWGNGGQSPISDEGLGLIKVLGDDEIGIRPPFGAESGSDPKFLGPAHFAGAAASSSSVQSQSLVVTSMGRTDVVHELAGGVEAQGLAVEHGGQEGGRLVALEPAAGVDQQRKAGGVAFGEAVFAEALRSAGRCLARTRV